MKRAEVDRRFTYYDSQNIGSNGVDHCVDLRKRITALGRYLARTLPEGREQERAVTKLEEALQWGIAAIVRPPVQVPED